jgi:hypothetical protein
MPRRRERDEHLDQPEMHVAVADDGSDVHAGEHEREPAEESVKIQQPRRPRLAPERARGQRETPQHRRTQDRPRDDTTGTSDVPEEHAVHQLPPLVVTADRPERELPETACGTVVDVVVDVDVDDFELVDVLDEVDDGVDVDDDADVDALAAAFVVAGCCAPTAR